MSTVVSFNGRTIADLAANWIGASDLYATGMPVHARIPRDSRMGVFMPEQGTVDAATFEVELLIPPPLSGHQAIRDDIRGWLQGAVEIELSDVTDRVLYGILEDIRSGIDVEAVAWTESEARRTERLIFTLPSPVWYDKYVRWQHIPAATATAVSDLGSRTSWFEVIIPGPAADPAVEYQLPSGHSPATLTTTGTVATGEYLRIVQSNERLYLGSGGTETGVQSWLQGSFGNFYTMDPGDGVPLIKTTHAAVLKYRRAHAA